jgi:hypothetical protein
MCGRAHVVIAGRRGGSGGLPPTTPASAAKERLLRSRPLQRPSERSPLPPQKSACFARGPSNPRAKEARFASAAKERLLRSRPLQSPLVPASAAEGHSSLAGRTQLLLCARFARAPSNPEAARFSKESAFPSGWRMLASLARSANLQYAPLQRYGLVVARASVGGEGARAAAGSPSTGDGLRELFGGGGSCLGERRLPGADCGRALRLSVLVTAALGGWFACSCT